MADDSRAEAANRARNTQADVGRRRRWEPARAALWTLLDAYVPRGATVAVVGAGNGDDVPLRRLARRAGRVDLIDIDGDAARVARRRCAGRRQRVRVVVSDITEGDADRAVSAAITGVTVNHSTAPVNSLPGGPYDLVIADLLYTQLLFPALLDAALSTEQVTSSLTTAGPQITQRVVKRLHASAPHGIVVHLYDLLGWWPGRPQPFGIEEVLDLAEHDPSAAHALLESGHAPIGADPRPALRGLGAEIIDTALWRWPFAEDVDYLVLATVARGST